MTSGGVALGWMPHARARLAASLDVARPAGATHGTERAGVIRVQQWFRAAQRPTAVIGTELAARRDPFTALRRPVAQP